MDHEGGDRGGADCARRPAATADPEQRRPGEQQEQDHTGPARLRPDLEGRRVRRAEVRVLPQRAHLREVPRAQADEGVGGEARQCVAPQRAACRGQRGLEPAGPLLEAGQHQHQHHGRGAQERGHDRRGPPEPGSSSGGPPDDEEQRNGKDDPGDRPVEQDDDEPGRECEHQGPPTPRRSPDEHQPRQRQELDGQCRVGVGVAQRQPGRPLREERDDEQHDHHDDKPRGQSRRRHPPGRDVPQGDTGAECERADDIGRGQRQSLAVDRRGEERPGQPEDDDHGCDDFDTTDPVGQGQSAS